MFCNIHAVRGSKTQNEHSQNRSQWSNSEVSNAPRLRWTWRIFLSLMMLWILSTSGTHAWSSRHARTQTSRAVYVIWTWAQVNACVHVTAHIDTRVLLYLVRIRTCMQRPTQIHMYTYTCMLLGLPLCFVCLFLPGNFKACLRADKCTRTNYAYFHACTCSCVRFRFRAPMKVRILTRSLRSKDNTISLTHVR